jgi:hypothetical protein
MEGIYIIVSIIVVTSVVLGCFIWDLLENTEFKDKD